MARKGFCIVLTLVALVAAGCTSPRPTSLNDPQSKDNLRDVSLVDPSPLLAKSPAGEMELESGSITMGPGETYRELIRLTTTAADQFAFPGYICATDDDPYGIGHVTVSSGGAFRNTIEHYGVEIWKDSVPGESCDGLITLWLYEGPHQYELILPITIVVG